MCNGHTEIVEILLANGAEANVTDSRGRTPVHWANSQGHQEILSLLIKARGSDGKTPLHWAVQHCKKAMVQLLLRKGAPIDVKDNDGQTPLDIANKHAEKSLDRKEIALLLQEYAGERQ